VVFIALIPLNVLDTEPLQACAEGEVVATYGIPRKEDKLVRLKRRRMLRAAGTKNVRW